MLGCKVRIIHERSDIIPISNNIPIPIPTKKSVNKKFYQNGNMNNSVDIYDLKKNFFLQMALKNPLNQMKPLLII